MQNDSFIIEEEKTEYEKGGVEFVKVTGYKIYNDGSKEVAYSFDSPKQSTYAPEPYQPTNAEVAQMISDLQADLIIAGVIEA